MTVGQKEGRGERGAIESSFAYEFILNGAVRLDLDQKFVESMEVNSVVTSNMLPNSSISTNTPSSTPDFRSSHLFLQTATCQAIAGAFTWAAILLTGYHVGETNERFDVLDSPVARLDLPSFASLQCAIGTEMDRSTSVHRAYLFLRFMAQSSDVHQRSLLRLFSCYSRLL